MTDFIDGFKNKAKGFTRLYYNLLKKNPIAQAVIPEPLWAIGDYKTNDDMTLDEALRNNVSIYARATDDEEWNPKKIQDVGQEAALMFIPEVGKGRKAVKEITKNGKVIGLDVGDLQDYTKSKQQQYFDLRDKAQKTEPNLPSKRKNSLLEKQADIKQKIDFLEEYKPESDKLSELRKEYLRLENQINDATIDMIDDPRDFGLAAYKNKTGLYKTKDIYPKMDIVEATDKNQMEFYKYLQEKYPAIYHYDLTEKVRNDIKREYPSNYEEIIDYIVGQGRPAAYDLNFRLNNLKQK